VLEGVVVRTEYEGLSCGASDYSRGSIVYNRDFMKLAIVGTRGIPANYGGFETFAEELSTRLAARGHDVTVYCRSPIM
jgi:hypothetical protein